ncbi:TPA: hypothetical protein ACG5DL_003585 [Klebsiella pneumoniae]
MRKLLLAFFLSVVFCGSAKAEISKFQMKAIQLVQVQKFTKWQHYASATTFIAMNGRPFSITLEDFSGILANTFRECSDMDAYTNRQGSTEACEAYVYKGLKEWIDLSKDPSVSDTAWKMGTSYAFNTHNPIPTKNIWDFNGWAAGIRVAKSKGY